MRTFASMFTGGDLAGIGAKAAGLSPIFGIEVDLDIAEVARMNGLENVIIKSVCDVDYSLLESPYWLHASPVCVNASVAKKDGAEDARDIEAARATARAIEVLQPPFFSLENVWKYREFESFKIICAALERHGYNFRFWHLNAADYGVPQTRKRLILVASRIRKVEKPQATHRQGGDMFLPAWVGWYEAIEDLIPTLPESKFAEWQLRRLSLTDTRLVTNQNDQPSSSLERKPVAVSIDQPAPPVLASVAQRTRAFLACVQGEASDLRECGEPSPVATTAHGAAKYRAFILSDQTNSEGAKVTRRESEKPCFVVDTRSVLKVRAWLSQGRVVAMTPRALARFQSIPDSYALPVKNSLACRVIGNAVPPLMMRKVIEANQ